MSFLLMALAGVALAQPSAHSTISGTGVNASNGDPCGRQWLH